MNPGFNIFPSYFNLLFQFLIYCECGCIGLWYISIVLYRKLNLFLCLSVYSRFWNNPNYPNRTQALKMLALYPTFSFKIEKILPVLIK
eukprot:UN28265